jgi:dihydrofolate synthase/folylpolyglutamate synthase
VAALNARGAELAVRRKFDLDHMRMLARALGDPQLQFPSVLIAGTNGKGSTAATLAAIARAAGLRTGLYTSPHLSRVNERICIWNSDKYGGQISNETFAQLFDRVEAASEQLVRDGKLPHPPSFFETLTAMAFCAFAEARVELAVLEVGLGGRLDATNIVEPLLSVITDIDLDHMEWLGNTLHEIAREKCGILRDHGTLVALPQHPEVNQAIGEYVATLSGVTAVNATEYIPSREAETMFRNEYQLQILGETVQVQSPLNGGHQQRNLALAIAAAVELRNQHGYKIAAAAIVQGIRETQWPGRLELLPSRPSRPAILLDVAHNAAGAWTLRAALSALQREQYTHKQLQKTLLFGCLADKPLKELAQILFTAFRDEAHSGSPTVFLTRPSSPRAADPAQLAEIAASLGTRAQVVEQPREALQAALEVTPRDGLLVCAGSVYLVGELRPSLLHD